MKKWKKLLYLCLGSVGFLCIVLLGPSLSHIFGDYWINRLVGYVWVVLFIAMWMDWLKMAKRR